MDNSWLPQTCSLELIPSINTGWIETTSEAPPVTIRALTDNNLLRKTSHVFSIKVGRLIKRVSRQIRLDTSLFLAALVIYLAVRLIGLANFPIYFFTDEAVQTVMAEDFVHNDLRDQTGELFPTYFSKDATYNLSSVSVYVQVIPYLLFGKSVYVTRLVSVLIGVIAALAVGLILRDIFKLRYWWCGVLLLSVAPAWFLHSRTAFETVEMTAFYAGFLYFYLRYRYISPPALYGALVMGALVFYTYSPGQLIIVVTGIFLLFSDLRYHWQQRKTALLGLLLLAVIVVPYTRYSLDHPQALLQNLTTRAPYWAQNIPLIQKLGHYFTDYAYGLNPLYWFIPNQHDLDRHLMKGYGHLLLLALPFFAAGLVIALTKLRSSAHRLVLFAMLSAPSGSALVGIGITRILVFVIPAVLMMTFGLEYLLGWVEKGLGWILEHRLSMQPGKGLFTSISLASFIVLGFGSFGMLRDALVNGPTWYQDYTLAGMQYGASQLFKAVNQYLLQHPGVEMIVTPSWTNGADAVAEFFLPPGAPVRMGSVEGHLFQHLALTDDTVFVMIQTEMDKVIASGKFKNVRVEQVIPYPNGAPGFYFAGLQYVDNIDQILEAEQQARQVLQEGELTILGQPAQVAYSMLDMGTIDLVFDGDQNTVARTLEANPFIVELTFSSAQPLSGYRMTLGSVTARVTAMLYLDDNNQPVEVTTTFEGSVSNPELDVDFGQVMRVHKLHFEIYQPYSGVPANVHVWEIEFR
jgi:4-amino-4-deoxy-L-arabinose transferase-like glycosyltransferase